MTIETYYNFIKIIECGSIISASQELMIAQPALSTQLKNLEKNLGVKLVERSSKKVSLTPAGEIFYQKAQTICSLDTAMHSDISNYIKGTAGTLKISMNTSNPPSLLHTLFDKFVEAHPNITFQFNETHSNQIAENVRNGISEIGIIRSKVRNAEDFHQFPYLSEELMVILSIYSPLAKYDSLTLEQIKNEPIATTDVLAPILTRAFQTINCEPNFYLRTSSRGTASFWISNYKNCIAILPCSAEERTLDELNCKVLRITDYDFSTNRSFLILKNRRLSPIAREFLHFLAIPCDFPDV